MAAGDFTATDLGRISARLNNLFNGERYNAQLNKPYSAVQALLERQTAEFSIIEEGGRCRGVKATYLKDCVDTVTSCSGTPIVDCAISGNQIESVSVNFDVNDCIYDSFTVYDDECQNNEYAAEEKTAFRLAKMFAKMRYDLEKKAIAFLDANGTDFNGITTDYFTVGTDTTNLEKSGSWTADLIGQILWMAEQHGVYEPFIIDGGNFWLEDWLNQFKTNGCCTVDALNGGPIDLVYATRTVRTETTKKSLFTIDPNAYAFWTKNHYLNTTPAPTQDQYNSFVWRTPLPGLQWSSGGTLQPIYIDMIRQRQCEIDSGQHRWKTVWLGKLHFVFNLGPDICTTGETGIIHFVNT